MAKALWRMNKRQNMAADLPQAPLSATPKRRRAAAKSNSPSGGDKTSRPRITPNNSMSVGPMTCVNCGTTRTPLWRRDPRNRPICNKCGLYLKSYGKMRPLSLKRALKHNSDPINTPVSVAAAASGCDCSSGGGCGGHSHRGDEDTCPGDGTCNGKGGGPSCDGCPAYNQKHLPHTTRIISTNGARRLTAAERAAAIANGASTDEHGNIIGLIPESAIGPGRIPPNVAAAIAAAAAANASNLSRVISDGSVSASESGSMTAVPATATATATTSCERAICFNCGTDYTPLWRRDADGNIACNACALFFKLHGRNRPISLKRNVIKRRRRGFNKKFASPADGSGIDNSNVHDDTASAAADDDDGDDESIS
ncbi:GATA type transcriptional activator of nitrogen-regulated proteins, partial [Kickxella alabastrina]